MPKSGSSIRLSRSGRRVATSAADFRRRNDLPYGRWVCADGREVLFNRFYEPIWERKPGEPPRPANPIERIPFVSQEWFYTDATKNKQDAVKAALAAWGISGN